MPIVEFKWKPKISKNYTTCSSNGISISDEVLYKNALWFIYLRWAVISLLATFQLASLLFPEVLRILGIRTEQIWPILIALALAIANYFYLNILKHKEFRLYKSPVFLILIQIVLDLIFLTIVIHYLGSVTTHAPYLYVLHIALSCIFLTIKNSFFITLFCSVLYSICITLEFIGIFPPSSIILILNNRIPEIDLSYLLFNTASITILFLLIWTVVSRLSKIIRVRESQLLLAQAETIKAQKERDKYILQMTHQLKSPLAIISTNINLLKNGYYGEKPSDEMQGVLNKIDKRARVMGEMILDVLKLEKIKNFSKNEADVKFTIVNTSQLLQKSINDLKIVAKRKDVALIAKIEPDLMFECNDVQIEMLFNNILSNAINYSHKNQTVTITFPAHHDKCKFALSISDMGIGIPEDKIPHIFDEYYRTKEALKHNRSSTGIGLSIVKNIARTHNIGIEIKSEFKAGTTFTILFPGKTQN